MIYFEVYNENYLVSSYDVKTTNLERAINKYMKALNDLDFCVNKEDFAVAKATIKRLRERKFELTESLFSDTEDTVIIVLENEEIECYF